MTRLCIDCKHYLASDSGASWDRCGKRPAKTALHLIRGEPEREFPFCDSVRSDEGRCGRVGAWFESSENREVA